MARWCRCSACRLCMPPNGTSVPGWRLLAGTLRSGISGYLRLASLQVPPRTLGAAFGTRRPTILGRRHIHLTGSTTTWCGRRPGNTTTCWAIRTSGPVRWICLLGPLGAFGQVRAERTVSRFPVLSVRCPTEHQSWEDPGSATPSGRALRLSRLQSWKPRLSR